MHRAIRFEHAAQRLESCIRVRKMMENPCAHYLVKAHLQIAYLLNGKLVDLEIAQAVFALEFPGTAHTRRAKVNAGHLSRRPAQGMLGRLRCPAASN
jgi:hypothetical protein